MRRHFALGAAPALLMLLSLARPAAAGQPVYASDVVTAETPGHAVRVEADVTGADKLYLLVRHGGDGYARDWCAWAEPRLIDADGNATKLTELEWESASAAWGEPRIGKNPSGNGPIRIAGETPDDGIGTHATSLIVYDLPKGHDFVTFKARGGLDDGGIGEKGSGSVSFHVYTERPPQKLLDRVAQHTGSRQNEKAPVDHSPANALAGLQTHPKLEAELFAAEPMTHSISNIDIDPDGRVWVCEIVNYRRHRDKRKEGDRILVLEDTDADGRADERTVFYQGTDINTPHGVCVLPDPHSEKIRAIVSSATSEKPGPNVTIFTDTDGDLKADKKQILFRGFGGAQHDHNVHAFTFGPDGRFYFNMGNVAQQVKGPDGRIVVDEQGNEVRADGEPYRQGMVFRTNIDLEKTTYSEFQTLGWNFRNNWMVTVDSFGAMWQSDNDDDGNRGVRINYVMPYGNYGYRDEITGANWRKPRPGMAEDVPTRHWHQHDPGVVPNLLQTGAGSPTGITVYEGRMLPEVFRGEMIHTDAGPNVTRSYPVRDDGAGYAVKKTVNLLKGGEDKWFRPSDVKVAPDGSLLVADWYDPGVGGHRAGDLNSGRIYRLTPSNGEQPYEAPGYDLSMPEGAVEALKNPNYSVRYTAWTALRAMGAEAAPALKKLWGCDNPRHRARALWLLGRIEGRGAHWVGEAIADENHNIRITGVRLAEQLDADVLSVVAQLVGDPSPQVRRACAIALHHRGSQRASRLWAKLAAQHGGDDRWQLEALGIGARDHWPARFEAWMSEVGGEWDTPGGRDIVWRSRAPAALPLLRKIILDPSTPEAKRERYFRAFHFHQSHPDRRREALIELTVAAHESGRGEIRAAALRQLGSADLSDRPKLRKAVGATLRATEGQRFVDLADRYDASDRADKLQTIALNHPSQQLGVDAAKLLVRFGKLDGLTDVARGEDARAAADAMKVLGLTGRKPAVDRLASLVTDTELAKPRRAGAVSALGRSRAGEQRLLKLVTSGELPDDLELAAGNVLRASADKKIRNQAAKHLTMPTVGGGEPLPPVGKLAQMDGDPKRGKKVFMRTCIACHKVEGRGINFGPDLGAIGDKLSKRAMYTAILDPSAGINFGFEGYQITLENGNQAVGYILNEDEQELTLRTMGGINQTYKKSRIASRKKLERSLMTEGLEKGMSKQELVDLVEYLTTLKGEKSGGGE